MAGRFQAKNWSLAGEVGQVVVGAGLFLRRLWVVAQKVGRCRELQVVGGVMVTTVSLGRNSRSVDGGVLQKSEVGREMSV